jgi:flagellar motor switch protein FliG
MIRIKGTVKKGKLVLSEPINLKEGSELDIIAYVDRTTGENLDKKSNILDLESEHIAEEGGKVVSLGSRGRITRTEEAGYQEDERGTVEDNELSMEDSILSKIKSMLNSIDLSTLISFLNGEHPQLIAILVEMMDRDRAKTFLENIESDLQGEIIYRIGKQQKVSSAVLNQIYNVLNRKLAQTGKDTVSHSGGLDTAVEMIKVVGRNSERNAVKYIEQIDPGFSDEIKKKLFVFEDIILLSDESLKNLVEGVDIGKLAMSMKGVSKELKDKIFANIQDNNKLNTLQEKIKKLGPVRIKDVEKAQEEIILIIRKLEEEGKVVIKTRDIIE